MKAIHCDAKTCQALIENSPHTIDIGGKRYDLCDTCFGIFTKWIAENLSGGEDIPPIYSPYTIQPISPYTGDSTFIPYWWNPPTTTWTFTNLPNPISPVPISMGNLSLTKGNEND